jgi:hypothetical protein
VLKFANEKINGIQNCYGINQNCYSMHYGGFTSHNYFKIILKKVLTNPLKSPIIYLLIERETKEKCQGSFDRLAEKTFNPYT